MAHITYIVYSNYDSIKYSISFYFCVYVTIVILIIYINILASANKEIKCVCMFMCIKKNKTLIFFISIHIII